VVTPDYRPFRMLSSQIIDVNLRKKFSIVRHDLKRDILFRFSQMSHERFEIGGHCVSSCFQLLALGVCCVSFGFFVLVLATVVLNSHLVWIWNGAQLPFA
jgi:hypothetical protein